MNRQYRRAADRQDLAGEGLADEGAVTAPPTTESDPTADAGTTLPPRRSSAAPTATPRARTTPRQFLHEVNVEMRKVAWPTRTTTVNYSTVVLFTLAILMALIFVLDLAFSDLSVFLFK